MQNKRRESCNPTLQAGPRSDNRICPSQHGARSGRVKHAMLLLKRSRMRHLHHAANMARAAGTVFARVMKWALLMLDQLQEQTPRQTGQASSQGHERICSRNLCAKRTNMVILSRQLGPLLIFNSVLFDKSTAMEHLSHLRDS